jgi:transposase
VFPNAVLVIDRFHVMKTVNQDLNKLRRKLGITDRGSKFVLLRNQAELNAEQILKLLAVLERSPILRITHEMKESFRQIDEAHHTVKSGCRQFEQWLKFARLFFADASASHAQITC